MRLLELAIHHLVLRSLRKLQLLQLVIPTMRLINLPNLASRWRHQPPLTALSMMSI